MAKWTKGTVQAAKLIARSDKLRPLVFGGMLHEQAVESFAEIISRETKAPEMAELLREWFVCYLHGTPMDKTRVAEKTDHLLAEIVAGD